MASDESVIQVTRPKGGSRDVFRSYAIEVDGQRVGKLRRGRSLMVSVAPGSHTVKARIDWTGSPELTVQVASGEVVNFVVEPGGRATQALADIATEDDYISLRQVGRTDA